HLTIADELEHEETDRNLQALAYHLEQAAHASLDLDPADRSVADRAVQALSKAGDKARRGIESRAAIDLYERSLALAGAEANWREDYAGAKAMFEEALAVARSNPEDDRWSEARALTFLASMQSGSADEDEVLRLGEEALGIARELGDPFTIAVALERVGTSLRR